MSETKAAMPKWVHRAASTALKFTVSYWSRVEKRELENLIAKSYAPEQARLRQEFLKLAKKWEKRAGPPPYSRPNYMASLSDDGSTLRALSADLRALVARELPLKEGKQ